MTTSSLPLLFRLHHPFIQYGTPLCDSTKEQQRERNGQPLLEGKQRHDLDDLFKEHYEPTILSVTSTYDEICSELSKIALTRLGSLHPAGSWVPYTQADVTALKPVWEKGASDATKASIGKWTPENHLRTVAMIQHIGFGHRFVVVLVALTLTNDPVTQAVQARTKEEQAPAPAPGPGPSDTDGRNPGKRQCVKYGDPGYSTWMGQQRQRNKTQGPTSQQRRRAGIKRSRAAYEGKETRKIRTPKTQLKPAIENAALTSAAMRCKRDVSTWCCETTKRSTNSSWSSHTKRQTLAKGRFASHRILMTIKNQTTVSHATTSTFGRRFQGRRTSQRRRTAWQQPWRVQCFQQGCHVDRQYPGGGGGCVALSGKLEH